MGTTAGGISFEEYEASPEINFDTSGVTAKRVFIVAWADYQNFIAELRGYGKTIAGQPIAGIPAVFPDNIASNLFCASAQVKPFTGNTETSNVFTLTSGLNRDKTGALITAQYKQFMPGVAGNNQEIPADPGTFFSYSRDGQTDYLTLPGRTFKWVSGANDGKPFPDDVHAGIPIGKVTHQLSWHRVQKVPDAAIATCRGKVNSSSFLGVAAGCLLFTTDRVVSEFGADVNNPTNEVQFVFLERRVSDRSGAPVKWNWEFDPGSGDWQAFKTQDGTNVFDSADFSTLLRQ